MTQEKTTMHQLEKDLIDELNSNKKEILENQYPEDSVTELADSYVPVYNFNLLQLACDDLWLGYANESGLSEGSDNAYDIIKSNVYEKLNEVAHTWLHDNQKKEVA